MPTDGRLILFIGDSLVEYFDWAERFSADDIRNLGYAGETVGMLLDRLPVVIDAHSEPAAVFVMSGINDLAAEDPGFIAEYRGVLRTLRQVWPGTRIFATSLLPTLLPWIPPGQITASNAYLRELADECGATYMDVHKTFSACQIEDLLSPDGVHLSDEGYRVWADEVEKALALL